MTDKPPGASQIPLPRGGPFTITRAVHLHLRRSDSGVIGIAGAPDGAKRRLAIHDGQVIAIDAGPGAPVQPEAQLRFLLRLRGPTEFAPRERLSARFSVDPFYPDRALRQHIDAQKLPHEPLRQRIGGERVAVVMPPHSSALEAGEETLVAFLGTAKTVPELLQHGALSPLRTLQLLVFLDGLGALLLGREAEQAERFTTAALRDALAVLELPTTARADELRAAYRRLARSLHPDAHPGLSAAEQRELTDRFARVHAAYRLLRTALGRGGGVDESGQADP